MRIFKGQAGTGGAREEKRDKMIRSHEIKGRNNKPIKNATTKIISGLFDII